jgi:hypothetical protein
MRDPIPNGEPPPVIRVLALLHRGRRTGQDLGGLPQVIDLIAASMMAATGSGFDT